MRSKVRNSLAVCGMCLVALGAAAADLPALFAPGVVRPDRVATVAAQPRDVARQRIVTVDMARIAPDATPAPALGIALFDDDTIAVDFVRIEVRGPGNYTWYGRVRDYDRSDVVLSVVDGVLAGGIGLASSRAGQARTYRLHALGNGRQLLQEMDPAQMPPDHPPGWTGAPVAPSPSEVQPAGVQADSGASVDVMVVYSDEAAAAAAGGIGADVQYAVDRANLAYSNSGITTQLHLVYAGPANYAESGDFNTDLNRLTSTADGYMDNVHTLRNTYGADVVTLLIENGAYCGLGYVNSGATTAFTVVNRGCSGGYLSMAHEIGHNFGALHDPYVDAGTSPYAWGHGYVFLPGQWRTVMAYNDQCVANGGNCTRIANFSSPNVNYGGSPTGTAATHNNARVHNDRAVTVANFRAAVTVSAPTVTTNAASAIASNGATLNGTVSSNGASTTVTFEYGATIAYGSTITASGSPLSAGASSQPVTAAISGLAACTPYHFRVVGANSNGTTRGADAAFTTAGCAAPPNATINAPSAVTGTTATFNGTVSSNGAATSVTFQYGLTTAYGSILTAAQSPLAANATNAPVSAAVTGFTCGTNYHVRLVATNSVTAVASADATFATSSCGGSAPTVLTTAVSGITATGATVAGQVSSNGSTTSVAFNYGTTASYGSSVTASPASLPGGATNQGVSAVLAGLDCGTAYHYRVAANNSAGTALGGDMSFATAACTGLAGSATTLASTANPAIAGTGVTLQATVSANAPSGTVGFQDGGSPVPGCAAVPVGGSGNVRNAFCSATGLSAGTHVLSAQYSGDAGNQPSGSNSVDQLMVASGPVTCIVAGNPYGPLSVTGGTLVGTTLTLVPPTTTVQLGSTPGNHNAAQLDCSGLHWPAGATLTVRSGAAGQAAILRNTNPEGAAIAGNIVAQGGNGAPAPELDLRSVTGIALGATANVVAPNGLTLDALSSWTAGAAVTNAGTVDGGPLLDVYGANIKGGGAFKGNAVYVHTYGTVNNPVAGAQYLGNSLQVYPSSGSDVTLSLNAYGAAPQFMNLKVDGNALLWMPSAWPAGSPAPANSAPLPAGAVRAPGVPEPAWGGGSIIVQATGSMQLLRDGLGNDFVFPGGIALKAGTTLDLDGVTVNQGWTTTGRSFQGIYLEASQIISALPVQFLSNDLNWTNFSRQPTGHFRVSRLTGQADGSARYVASDAEAPHLNTYSTLIDAAANGQCWTCLVNFPPIAVQ